MNKLLRFPIPKSKIPDSFCRAYNARFLPMFKLIKRVIGVRRMGLSMTGLLRFLNCIDFNLQTLNSASDCDKEMFSLLISECGFPLTRYLFYRYTNKMPTFVKFGEDTFMTHDFEDFYHASLFHERRTLDFALKHFRDGGIFVDVGANVGGYTVRLSKIGRVYAFEPLPRNYRLLTLNIRLNDLQNAKTYNQAVSDHVGRVNFYLSSFHGRHSIVRGTEFIHVDAVTLDSILENEDEIDIIKLDVEGAEPLVLKGAVDALKRTKIVIVETTTPYVNDFVHKYLHKYGFRCLEKCEGNSIFMKLQHVPF